MEHSELLSSISRKLKPKNIQVYSRRSPMKRSSTIYDKNGSMMISCFPVMAEKKEVEGGPLDYWHLRCRVARGDTVIENVHKIIGDKKGCLE